MKKWTINFPFIVNVLKFDWKVVFNSSFVCIEMILLQSCWVSNILGHINSSIQFKRQMFRKLFLITYFYHSGWNYVICKNKNYYIVRNAVWARSRNPWKLSLIFDKWINQWNNQSSVSRTAHPPMKSLFVDHLHF